MTRHFRIGLFVALAGMVGLHVRPFIGCAVDALLARAALVSNLALVGGSGLDTVARAPEGASLAGAFAPFSAAGAAGPGSDESDGVTPPSQRPALCALAAEAFDGANDAPKTPYALGR